MLLLCITLAGLLSLRQARQRKKFWERRGADTWSCPASASVPLPLLPHASIVLRRRRNRSRQVLASSDHPQRRHELSVAPSAEALRSRILTSLVSSKRRSKNPILDPLQPPHSFPSLASISPIPLTSLKISSTCSLLKTCSSHPNPNVIIPSQVYDSMRIPSPRCKRVPRSMSLSVRVAGKDVGREKVVGRIRSRSPTTVGD